MARKSSPAAHDWLDGIPLLTVVLKRSAEIHRNIAGTVFPDRLSAEQLKAVRDRVLETLGKKPSLFPSREKPIVEEDPLFDKLVDSMVAIDLVAQPLLDHRAGAALLSSGDGMTLRVNEEDHITVSAVDGSFSGLLHRVEPVVEKIGAAMPLAQNAEYGFLSANPDLVGTGLRLSCVFSLIGLYLTKEIDQVLRGLERLGFEVRPLYVQRDKDEAQIEAPGFCYKVTSLQSMGSAEEIAIRMDRVCAEVAYQEQNARYRALHTRGLVVDDFVRRAVGVGNTAVLLTEGEALDILHTVLFGIDLGLLDSSDEEFYSIMEYSYVMVRPAVEYLVSAKAAFPVEPEFSAQFARALLVRDITDAFLPQCSGNPGGKMGATKKRSGSGRKAKAKSS